MGRTYNVIWTESKERWIAERANIMESLRSHLKDENLQNDRSLYGFSVRSHRCAGKQDMYMQLKIHEDDVWREKVTGKKPKIIKKRYSKRIRISSYNTRVTYQII